MKFVASLGDLRTLSGRQKDKITCGVLSPAESEVQDSLGGFRATCPPAGIREPWPCPERGCRGEDIDSLFQTKIEKPHSHPFSIVLVVTSATPLGGGRGGGGGFHLGRGSGRTRLPWGPQDLSHPQDLCSEKLENLDGICHRQLCRAGSSYG